MASYGGELLLDSSSPWSSVSSLSSFSIPLPFIFQEAKESIDEEDPRLTSSNGAYITRGLVTWLGTPLGSQADHLWEGGCYMHNRVVSTNSAHFPKWEYRVDTLRLFPDIWLLLVRTTLHLSVESGACIILCSLDWVRGWMMSNCWMWMMNTFWIWVLNNCCCVCSSCLPMFLANCGYLELVLVLFIMNSPLQFCIVWLIPVMITNIVRGSRMTTVGCRKWNSGEEPLSRRDDIGIILGGSCVLWSTPP